MISGVDRWCCFHFGRDNADLSTSIHEKWPKMLESNTVISRLSTHFELEPLVRT